MKYAEKCNLKALNCLAFKLDRIYQPEDYLTQADTPYEPSIITSQNMRT